MDNLESNTGAAIEPPDTLYIDRTEPDSIYSSSASDDPRAKAHELSCVLAHAAQAIQGARQISKGRGLNGTLEGYYRHLSRLAAYFGKLAVASGDCVLCSGGSIRQGVGAFWTDNRWICRQCGRRVVENLQSGVMDAGWIRPIYDDEGNEIPF